MSVRKKVQTLRCVERIIHSLKYTPNTLMNSGNMEKLRKTRKRTIKKQCSMWVNKPKQKD